MARYYDRYWPAYVSVAERRRRATGKIVSLQRAGQSLSPVQIAGRRIATTFWGKAWCENLEAYSDFANRLPRGRSYVRNGSVLDLAIEAGRVRALVMGTELYTVDIAIQPLVRKRWTAINGQCAGQIDSLVELLQGNISQRVMAIVTRRDEGLFPAPRAIRLSCSCPDWAAMCKHVAATLYAVGARLDRQPELLFTLRGVDPAELVAAALEQPVGRGTGRKPRVLKTAELTSVFGVDIDTSGMAPVAPSKPRKRGGPQPRAAAARTSAGVAAGRKTAAATPSKPPAPAKRAAGRTTTKRTATRAASPAKAGAGKKTPKARAATRKAPRRTAD